MNCTIRIFFVISLLCTAISSFSQPGRALIDSLAHRMEPYSKTGGTSVYLASNKEIYIAGEDLWYNAFVLDQQTFGLAEQESILYLQLKKKEVTRLSGRKCTGYTWYLCRTRISSANSGRGQISFKSLYSAFLFSLQPHFLQ
ncbi:hypothetical protein [Chitinophaga pinensis]|uniref:Uncharacterized protein n=1 Tax=Chitinophaga pinensis TaxID=79329 RepID=A0A5C6LS58_9BACT|nr:hypothetical protein [Chitinophaga pinensis]TWW00091.1 hypothetical protein FEF09_12125 [Chitinophaga pinensis]